MMRIKIRIILAFAVVLAAACSNHLPQVSNVQWDLTIYKDSKSSMIYEELSIFFLIKDEDGEDDIDEIFIIYDDGYEYWKLDENNWTKKELDGDIWVGCSRLQNNTTFPRKEYRYLVIDKTGERVEGKFFIDINEFDPKNIFPSAEVNPDDIKINSQQKNILLSVFDYNDQGLELSQIEKGTYKYEQLFKKENLENVAYFYLIEKKQSEGYLLKTGPYIIESTNASNNETDSQPLP